MHIVFFTMVLNKGGSERVIVNLCNEHLIKKHKITIITCLSDQSLYHLNTQIVHVKIDKTQKERTQNKSLRFFRRRKKLEKILKEIKPDIIISFLPEPSFLALSLKSKLQIPLIISERSDPALEYRSFIYKIIIKLLYTNGDGFVFQTEDAMKWFDYKTQTKSIIIPNPLTSDACRTRYKRNRKKEIVAVGRLVPEKNYQMLFYALKEVLNEFPEYILRIYGEGPLQEELEECKRKLGLDEKIFLMGNKDDIFDWIYDSALFVLSSKVEGMPNSLMEAMALGLPVIATDCPCGGPRFLIDNGDNGILVKNDNVQEMVQGIRNVLSNPELAEKIGQNASKIAEKLAPEKINKKWEDYIDMIKNKGI